MKKFFLLLFALFAIDLVAKDLAKINIAVMRDKFITHGKTCMINDGGANIVYEDERTYIEADIVEISDTQVILRCLVSTAAIENNGMMVVRGMPRLVIPMCNGMGMASLNCDGKDEHFMLIVSVCPC